MPWNSTCCSKVLTFRFRAVAVGHDGRLELTLAGVAGERVVLLWAELDGGGRGVAGCRVTEVALTDSLGVYRL